MAAADAPPAVEELARELEDRFGPMPPEVENLVAVLRLRILAHGAAATSVGREGPYAAVRWANEHGLARDILKTRLGPEVRIGRQHISVPLSGGAAQWLAALQHVLVTAAEVRRRAVLSPAPSGT
jgi:transcription-repair coupling factor (superfamily II helicase)